MKVLYSPCRSDKKIKYDINGEIIKVTFQGVTDTFDFTDTPDGKLDSVKTNLKINPIISAERVNGELKIVLLNFIGQDATDEERFPDWKVIE